MLASLENAPFEGLRDRLLQGGVRPRHARRYLSELQDHLDDLIAEERQAAKDERDARAKALARLGSPEALAGAMIARREFLSWSRKAPAAVWLIAPALTLTLGTALAMGGVVMTAVWLRGGASSDLPAWAHGLAGGVGLFTSGALAILLGWALAAMALRQRSAPFWPTLGLVALAALGAAIQLDISLPSAAAHGEIGFASPFASLSDSIGYAGRLSVNLALTLAPYVCLRRWREDLRRGPAREGEIA